jgi:hypothetical protein
MRYQKFLKRKEIAHQEEQKKNDWQITNPMVDSQYKILKIQHRYDTHIDSQLLK